MNRLTHKDLPLGTIVRVVESIKFTTPSLANLAKPFSEVGSVHTVTGYHGGGDVYLDGAGWGVSPSRLEKLGFALYSVTENITSDNAGSLAELEPGERFVLSDDKQGKYSHVLHYLDREQGNPHYTDREGEWIAHLLECGAIVRGNYDAPKAPRFNSVFDAPLGAVLQYTLNGELAAGAVYQYVMRSWQGLWVYVTRTRKWEFIHEEYTTAADKPYLHDIQRPWSDNHTATWQEVYAYPAQLNGLRELRNDLIKE